MDARSCVWIVLTRLLIGRWTSECIKYVYSGPYLILFFFLGNYKCVRKVKWALSRRCFYRVCIIDPKLDGAECLALNTKEILFRGNSRLYEWTEKWIHATLLGIESALSITEQIILLLPTVEGMIYI